MSFEMFEAMRTNLADEIRTAERAGNGNAAMAASIVRSEMEKLPMTPGTGEQLKGLADTARGLAKARFDMIKKDPAYKAIVKAEDATINEKLPADNFYDKFVLNGAQRNLQTMIETFGENSPVHQEIRAGTMFHLKERAGIDSENRGNFTQAGYNKALEKLDRSNKMGTIFDAEGQRLTRALGNTAFRIQFQPKGSFVSNPNTVVGLIREASAGALEKAFNMTGIPAGTLARQALEAASQRKAAEPYLAPLAGVRIQRVKGQPKAPTLKELEEKTSPGMTPKGRGQRGAITLGGVPKTERTGTAPTLSQLPENQKLGQTLVGKKQRGSVEVVEKGSEMIYHGTTAKAAAAIERDGFDLSLSADGTVWFTSNPKIGEVAASGKGGVVARSVSDLKLGGWKEADLYSTNELIAKGYDGLKLVDEDEITYQIFFPEKLKIPGQSGTGTAPTLSQLPENQKLGQTLVGKKQRGSVGVSKSESNPILISSQRYLDPKIIAEKQKNKDYVVTISPAFEANGETMQVVIDGHHSLAAAKKDGAKPTFVVAKKQNDDRIGLLEKSVDDYLESNYMDSDWYNVKNGDTVF
jgi:hypothetical protein